MKFSILAALVGVAVAGGSLRGDKNCVGCPAQTTTGYTEAGSGAIKTFLPVASVGGGDARLTGVSDLASTSLNTPGSPSVTSASTGLNNIGTGSVLITSTTTGNSQVYTGKVINPPFPQANLGALQQNTANLINNNVIANGVINTAISNSSPNPNLNLNNLFGKLPTTTQVDTLIMTSDSVALLKLIQTVGLDNTIPCDQRIAYLLELHGRLRAAIEIKGFAALQLKIVIDTAVIQINRLRNQIDQNNKDIDRLGLDALNIKLNGLLADLELAYANYNRLDTQIPVLQAQVAGSEKQIDILVKNSDNERNAVNNNKLKLGDVINEINTLQAKLKELADRQAAVQASIRKGQNNIAFNDKAIADLRAKNDVLQIQLRDLNDQADRLSSLVRDFEVKVGRLRTQISVAQTKKSKLLRDNSDFQDRIDIQKKKNVTTDYTKLINMVDALKRIIPTVQSEVDRHYYYCFGDGKVQVQVTGGVTVYVVRGDAFANYLRALYGRNIILPAVNGDVLFNKIDIFGAAWSGAFGYPFGQASLGGGDLSIGGSFGCTSPTSVVSGFGTITAIGANYIECSNATGVKQRFNLGSCSRLEATKTLPKIGQRFFWSGVPASQGYNVYAASCLD